MSNREKAPVTGRHSKASWRSVTTTPPASEFAVAENKPDLRLRVSVRPIQVGVDPPDILYQFDRAYSEGFERDGGVGQGPAFEALAPHPR
jgi:hypothetical protein